MRRVKVFEDIGLGVPEVLLPNAKVALDRWAVIACDQYTSQPEYWQKVADLVGDAPSTLRLIYPEVFLGEPEPEARARITDICASMQRYLDEGVLRAHEGFVYLERQVGDRTRRGLITCLDLDAYDYNKGSASLIRATEGTILSRLPPRMKVREGAPLELPHIMVLIDDPEDSVIGPLRENKASLEKLYDFELMLTGGHLTGYAANAEGEAGVVSALRRLRDPETFASKYAVDPATPVLLYAMGDGNHSLATAKAIWENLKKAAKDPAALAADPRRYALVELVNLHDDAMVFEPIHRVLFDVKTDLIAEMKAHFGDRATFSDVPDLARMTAAVEASTSAKQRFGIVSETGHQVVELEDAGSNLPIGSLQAFLDPVLEAKGASEIDYVHGTEALSDLGRRPKNLGFFLPAMDKHDLFKTVILDGALPRKTFSMGEADEKRFYMECRRLT